MLSLVYVMPLLLLALALHRLSNSTKDVIGIVLIVVSIAPLAFYLGPVKALLIWLAMLSISGFAVVVARGLATRGR